MGLIELLESSLSIIVSLVVLLSFSRHVFTDVKMIQLSRQIQPINDSYISTGAKFWSGIFVIVMAIALLYTKQTLEVRSLNAFLIVSLSGIFLDQFSLSGYVYASISCVSWYEIYSLFMATPAGIDPRLIADPKWILAFYLMTSVVITGHLQERTRVTHPTVSGIHFALVVLLWSLPVPLAAIAPHVWPEISPVLNRWIAVPVRLQELELGHYHRLVSLVVMAGLHFGTRYLILAVDGDLPAGTSSFARGKKEDGEDVEGAQEGESEDSADPQLPPDAVEVSEEEAVRICDGGDAMAFKQTTGGPLRRR